MTTLTDLLARVEAATTWPDREIDCALACHLDGFWANLKMWPTGESMTWRIDFCRIDEDGGLVSPGHGGDQMVKPYTASIDAALALAERVLPGWFRTLDEQRASDADVTARCWIASLYSGVGRVVFEVTAPTPALALIAAILKALIADETKEPSHD